MVRRVSRNEGRRRWARKSSPCPRFHRRPRPTTAVLTRSRCPSTKPSFLHLVPAEVFDMILDKLTVLEISVFSMVSKEITGYVVDYISTLAWKNKTIITNFHHSSRHEQRLTLGHYRNLGLLFKRCTLLLPTKDRLKFIFSKLSHIPCFMLEQCVVPKCLGFTCYGVFLQTLIAGWDELECHRVFNFLCELTNLQQRTEAVIAANPGTRCYEELQLRLFCREVLLEQWKNQPECQFWLLLILKPWPMVSQAHLLFILYGPQLPEGTLARQELVERGLPHRDLWDLAKAILVLFSKLEAKDWCTDSIITIFEELIVIPQPWLMENVARLLVLCGSGLCYTILASKALNGRLLEISRLIVFIIVVCEKDGYHMIWAVRLVQEISKLFSTADERLSFIQQFENTFSEVTREFFEVSLAGNRLDDRDTFQTLCILLDSSARFHTKLLHMFLNQ